MISLDDAARQMAGAWKMAFGREDWRRELDRSVDGVFGSFAAFVFAAPLAVLFTIAAKRAAMRIPDFADTLYQAAPLSLLLAGDFLTFAIDWTASLGLLIALARATGAGRNAADLIVGYNWIQPVIAAINLPAIAVMSLTANAAAGGLFGVPAFAMTIFLYWGIIRRGLNATALNAFVVLFMLVVVGAAIDIFGSAAMRALIPAQS